VWASALLFLFLLTFLTTPVSAADKDVIAAGKREFRHSCALCHGPSGGGESEMTRMNLLTTKPPDLRKLKKHNQGTFPFWQTYQVVDGRQEIMAHGIGRILQLIYYLESIQE
jgi:mono/diheme cytochrome c family protein